MKFFMHYWISVWTKLEILCNKTLLQCTKKELLSINFLMGQIAKNAQYITFCRYMSLWTIYVERKLNSKTLKLNFQKAKLKFYDFKKSFVYSFTKIFITGDYFFIMQHSVDKHLRCKYWWLYFIHPWFKKDHI